MQAAIYARVSSKEQADEGFSIPAQLKLLREYALEHGYEVAREFVDVETAKRSGRPSFGEMTLLLDAALATDPGFAIDVAVVDYAADPVVITIDLVPTREITGTNVVLNVAIVENPIVYDTPPGSYGETEFHWICREYAQVSTSPLPISPAAPGHFEFNLTKQANWTGVETANLWTIVFVQNETTLEVIQAGALVPTAHLQAAATPHLPTLERTRP